MGEGDYTPAGHHHKKYDPDAVKRLKEGGKKADEIRQLAMKHHQEHDVPTAEQQLLKDLEDVEDNNKK